MQITFERCCGLDVHKRMVVACLLTLDDAGSRRQAIRRFSTMTQDLLALADWLTAAGCTQVAMESTGVFWKPIYNLFEGLFEVLVVNAQHLKAVAFTQDRRAGCGVDCRGAPAWEARAPVFSRLRPNAICAT